MEVNYMIPKFRVWDKEADTMHDVTSIWFDRNNEQYKLGHVSFPSQETVDTIFDNFELMQSTGLKDKNGVEIFEGDVVKVSNHPFQKKEDSPGIEIDGNYFINWSEHSLTWLAGDLLLYQLKPYIEVIGNVFANPELLEVEG